MMGFDWGEAWKREQAKRRHADDADYWNMRAPSFAKTAGTSPYAKTFLKLAGIQPGETVFDMGCGSGTLALPLAREGHVVEAADFSTNMLKLMMKRAELEGASGFIHSHTLAWKDDFANSGIPVCDVAVASRSIATDDMLAALSKLNSMARRRVCLTLATSSSPRHDPVIGKAMGIVIDTIPDYIFAMNILFDMGIEPELTYIRSERSDVYASKEEAVEKFATIYEVTTEQHSMLEAYTENHMIPTQTADGKQGWKYDHMRVTSWAFISWEK